MKKKLDPSQVLVVEWEANEMYYHPTNPEIAQCQSTASSQQVSRLQKKLTSVMEASGSIIPRQAVVIHDYCTKIDPVLGHVLETSL